MIDLNELRIGNWISLKMAGSLIAAHKILGKDQLSIHIADIEAYALSQTHEGWRYLKEPRIRSLSARDIKGIPLSADILDNCSFVRKPFSPDLSDKNCYTLEDFSVISYGPVRQCTFTDISGSIPVRFVHELQNIFFKMLNKELDITIPAYNYEMSAE